MMDITGRKRAEEESEEARRHFETLFQVTVDPVVIVDRGGTILEITERVEEITGFTRGELRGRNFLRAGASWCSCVTLRRGCSGGDIPSYEVGLLTKDGRELLFDVKAKRIEYRGSPAVMASFRDIGDRKAMELRLRESEGRLRQLIEHAPDSTLILDLEGVVVDCNTGTLELYGYSSKGEVVGKSSFEFIAERDRGKALDSLEMTLKVGFDKDREYGLLRRDGTEFRGEVSASLVRDGLGEPVSIIAVTEDVTEIRRYQERLESLHRHASELTSVDTLEEIAERSFTVIESILGFGHGGFGVVDEFSLRFIKMAGEALEQVVELPLDGPGITVRAAVTGETPFVTDISFDENYVPIVVGDDYSYQQELAVPVKIEGEVVAVLNVESAMADAFSEEDRILMEILALHVASAIANIRQRERIRSSEGELRGERDRLKTVNEKLNVVGRLSRHDVRNKLSIIINNLYILRQILGNESELTSYLERIGDTCGSITDVFDFAADYERLGLEEMKPVNVGEAFRMAVNMFDISGVRVENGCGGLIVYADSLLSRLFYNLIDNSLKRARVHVTVFLPAGDLLQGSSVPGSGSLAGLTQRSLDYHFQVFGDPE
jgi:PAS domain S-box-containing protein